jgi:hypothetical protein
VIQSSKDPSTTEVFISYRTGEQTGAEAELLHRRLDERNINVFFDVARLTAGDRWSDVIKTAIASPHLAVGVVLMRESWFHHFKPDLATDIVWKEVAGLRQRLVQQRARAGRQGDRPAAAELKVLPVVIRSPETGDLEPAAPADDAPNHDRLIELRAALNALHYCWIVPKSRTRLDDLVADIAQTVRYTVLGRPLRGSITAELTAPLPLSLLKAESATRRGLHHYAEFAGAYEPHHRFATILGQDALLDHDHVQALAHLTRAKSMANTQEAEPAVAPGAALRRDLWRIHLMNLSVIAALRGERPRRRQITEARQLLTDLLKGVKIAASRLGTWPPGSDEQASADRRSAAYVMELTLDLLWLLWQDFFVERNVRLPEHDMDALVTVRERLSRVGQALATLYEQGEPLPGAGDDRRFLVENGYLEGLPRPREMAERWYPANVLGGLTTLVDKELSA